MRDVLVYAIVLGKPPLKLEAEASYQKGFVWVLGALGETSIAPDIANFAFGCFRKSLSYFYAPILSSRTR
jgi:hypothetical protein